MYNLLGNKIISYDSLLNNFSVKFNDERKKSLFSKAFNFHKNKTEGEISINRVSPNCSFIYGNALIFSETETLNTDSFFNYEQDQNTNEKSVWWFNFADPDLFGYYSSSLFAQDEMQVFEHPLLAYVRNYLLSLNNSSLEPRTVRDNGLKREATPFIICNVPQWQIVNTKPILSNGTVGNIYGNNFQIATEEEIAVGIKICTNNQRNNIVAISAPYGEGKYSREQIKFILEALLCAFSFIRSTSNNVCVIHGGNWGCGAFGGNRVLMYLAQLFAASVCGIDKLIFHNADNTDLDTAKKLLVDIKQFSKYLDVITYLEKKDFSWGFSDGN